MKANQHLSRRIKRTKQLRFKRWRQHLAMLSVVAAAATVGQVAEADQVLFDGLLALDEISIVESPPIGTPPKIEYTVINGSQTTDPDDFDAHSIFAFFVEVDESTLNGEPNLSSPEHFIGRDGWDGGDASGGLISGAEWDAGILLTNDFRFGGGGLSTIDLGNFDELFSGDFQVAFFYDTEAQVGNFGIANMILPGTMSDSGDFQVGPLFVVNSDALVICNDPNNPLCGAISTIPLPPAPNVVPLPAAAWMGLLTLGSLGVTQIVRRKRL